MKNSDWIYNKLIETEMDKAAVRELYDEFVEETGSTSSFQTFRETISRVYNKLQREQTIDEDRNILEPVSMEELSEDLALTEKELGKVYKSNQRLQDKNRVVSKLIRENNRIITSIEEYSKVISEVLQDNKELKKIKIKKFDRNEAKFGILQLSDLHFNELVHDHENIGNSYDFNVASKRLQKFVHKARKIFKSHDIKNVLIAMTGDLMNSDRRMDEAMNSATNRGKATLLGYYLLKHVYLDLATDFGVCTAAVTGNESRADLEHGYSEAMATNNYDFTLYNFLKENLKDTGIEFTPGPKKEQVVSIAGINILLVHGESVKKANPSLSVQNLIGKYSALNVRVHFVLCGHIHEALVSDILGRSSSLVGGNAYSSNGLNLISRASQNCYIANEDQSIDGFKIDLQTVDGYEGYNVIKELEEYNPKSALKNIHHKPIHIITI
jgi:predicted phosphodiesterase